MLKYAFNYFVLKKFNKFSFTYQAFAVRLKSLLIVVTDTVD